MYGKELILDLHNCKVTFDRAMIRQFMEEVCDLLEMERADLHFWDYDDLREKQAAPDHLAGTSAVQFITTSNITIHTLDRLNAVYLNIFTCKDLDSKMISNFCERFWQGDIQQCLLIGRQ